MKHTNTVFYEILKQISRPLFDKAVKRHKGDYRIRTLSCWTQFIALLKCELRAVSQVRQPIETLFGWIEEKTGVECAGKVRSDKGLMVHVFGRFAATMFFWNKLRISS